MAYFSPLYILIFLLVVALTMVLGNYLGSRYRKKKLATIPKAIPQDDAESKRSFELLPFVGHLLRKLNCSYTHTEKDEWHEFNFKYQNGNFILICKEGDALLRFHYPHFISTKIDDLDLVREVCNTCNAHGFSHHIIYTADGKENTLSVHITSSLTVVCEDEKYVEQLGDTLSHFFSLAQEFYLRFDKGKERYKDVTPYDAEENYLKYDREFFMLREMEMKHQPSKVKLTASPRSPLTISKLLINIYGWDNPELLELKIITHQMKTIVNDLEIEDFDISHVLIATNSEGEPNFIGRNATLILTFSPDKNFQQCFPSQLVIALKNEGVTEEALYQRATLSMPPMEAHNKNSEYAKDNVPNTLSFIFAFDKNKREDIEAEVEKTLAEMAEKCNNSDFTHLKPEEILAFKFDNPDIRYFKLHAERLFREKRYYETIHELEYLYNYASPRFLSLSRQDQKEFYEVCYYIGFSYEALGLHKQAYYYLDAIYPLNQLTYMEEYVNCLVNSKDFRVLSVIENMENLINNQVADADGMMPESLQHFSKFLQRRKAHHLVDLGYYDKAKELFEILYQDPECQDYALSELAYLQKLREHLATRNEKKGNEDNS